MPKSSEGRGRFKSVAKVERVVLNALNWWPRLCRVISAPSARIAIVFGEADPPEAYAIFDGARRPPLQQEMIIRARIVVTMNGEPIENGAVAASAQRIVDV